MRYFQVFIVFAVLSGVSFPVQALQTQVAPAVTPQSRIERVAEINSIDAEGMHPWYLKLSYKHSTIAAPAKANGDEGVVEEWWADHDNWRIVLDASPDGKRPAVTYVKKEGRSFHSAGAGEIPSIVALALARTTHAVSAESLRGSVPEVRVHGFGKVKLDCIMLTQPVESLHGIPLGLYPTYCVNAENVVQFTQESLNISSTSISLGKFLDHYVPLKVNIRLDEQENLAAEVTKLATVAPSAIDLSTDGLTEGDVGRIKVSSGDVAGQLLKKVVPEYPRGSRVSGVVLLRGIVGTDGHVYSLQLIKSPDPSLSIAALEAVEHWTYKPYLLNGEPTSVDTTITVNFTHRP